MQSGEVARKPRRFLQRLGIARKQPRPVSAEVCVVFAQKVDALFCKARHSTQCLRQAGCHILDTLPHARHCGSQNVHVPGNEVAKGRCFCVGSSGDKSPVSGLIQNILLVRWQKAALFCLK